MIFSRQYLQGVVIASLTNNTSGIVEILVRLARINGIICVIKDTLADTTNVKPLAGREYLTTIQAGVAGYTTAWKEGFTPADDIAKVPTSVESALAFNINLGIDTSGGTLITANSYVTSRVNVISNEYIEGVTGENLLSSNEGVALVVGIDLLKKFLKSENIEKKWDAYLAKQLKNLN